MKLFEIKYNVWDHFKKKKTGVDYWDDMMENPPKDCHVKIVEMDPVEYLKAGSDVLDDDITDIINTRDEKASDYAEEMKDGKKFKLLVLDYYSEPTEENRWGQNGFHRALAAHYNNYPTVPVVVFRKIE